MTLLLPSIVLSQAVFQPEDPLGVVGVGVPIQIQVEGGRTVAATLMQEVRADGIVHAPNMVLASLK